MSSFEFVSGRLCLDLAGTLLWRRTTRSELLRSPDDLRRWIMDAQLIEAPALIDARALERTRRLRETIYRLATSWPPGSGTGGSDDIGDMLAEVNDAARLSLPRVQIDETGQLSRTGGIDEVLGAAARDLVELLGSPQFSRLRECRNPDCTRLFVDLSHSGARRWCGMAGCGNRQKAERHRRRKKEAMQRSR
ncbi:CGNR zinc finger domain-containing protein [Saccharopolyspora sp. K220]|uniref:CGNR zinc finger domain-containing protein n=1 Tax=Saccharopolyspora soli TaxID=2926618 RepID=UPI001F574DAD|nr:ABATE domain-containing protein [Saccharopolyspora soli]MCI2423778.1 CGNR zinc finger domain-containing protein [Saccharopolyspora soli]